MAERTAELAVARDRAEAADRLKSAFLATMSHELRTPLNSIIGFTGIILQGLAGPLNAEQRKQLEMVRDSARHLLALINDVLDISKIEAGQLEVRSEPFDLRASIEKVAGIVKPLAEKKGLALRVELAPEIGTFDKRPAPRRTGAVEPPQQRHQVHRAGRGHAHGGNRTGHTPHAYSAIRISVADTGIGIKPEDLGKLFQPFRQIDSGLTRQHEGTGLGLAICRRLAELLGGEVQAASDWGKGSVFTFTLPMKGPGESMKEKILLIEDNEQNRYLATFLLEKHGYEVIPASDGPLGIELAGRVQPHLILLDIQLPTMDGYAVARQLRNNPALAKHSHRGGDLLRHDGRPGENDRTPAATATSKSRSTRRRSWPKLSVTWKKRERRAVHEDEPSSDCGRQGGKPLPPARSAARPRLRGCHRTPTAPKRWTRRGRTRRT